MDTVKAAIASALQFTRLVWHNSLHLRRSRIGQRYVVTEAGSFAIFRETINRTPNTDSPVVLVVGFRLKLLRSQPFWHWLFQRVCILTTPFWSGFQGFHVKLWLVDPKTKNYLGIYDWYGHDNAVRYVATLVKILKPLSVPNSVWFSLESNESFENYLNQRLVSK